MAEGRRWCEPEQVPRLWAIREIGPVQVGAVLALYRGSEAELLSWLPPGPFAWEWLALGLELGDERIRIHGG